LGVQKLCFIQLVGLSKNILVLPANLLQPFIVEIYLF